MEGQKGIVRDDLKKTGKSNNLTELLLFLLQNYFISKYSVTFSGFFCRYMLKYIQLHKNPLKTNEMKQKVFLFL